jgi:outer membrane protein assembly factor BamA
VAALVLALLLVGSGRNGFAQPVHIGTIRIESQNVFSPSEAENGWFYRLANSIHIRTRDSFLRKQLLFHEGDVLDVAVLAETERNLRSLPFIKSASVTASAPRNGVSDVLVVTQDAWTTQPGGSFGSKGGRTTYSVELQETDFLGTGRSVAVSYDHEPERNSRSLEISDPYLFRPFWRGRLFLASNSDGRQRDLEIRRPFFSFTTRWSAGGELAELASTEKIYLDGRVESTFHAARRERSIEYGRALRASESNAARLSAGFDSIDAEFSTEAGKPAPVIPGRREFRYVYASFESVGNDFVTMNHVNQGIRYEDFNLAPRLFLKGGYSPTFLGAARNSGLLAVETSGGLSFGEGSFAQADVLFETRLGPEGDNRFVSGFVGYVRKFTLAGLDQAFVARAQADRGWELDADKQFAADGATGLRGYRLHAMTGNRRVILNLEDRWDSGRELLQLVSPGAVVFLDAGTAVPESRPMRWKDFRVDAGVGLRFGIARAGRNNIFRIDFAYGFNADPAGRRGLLISFSSSQAFSFRRTGFAEP